MEQTFRDLRTHLPVSSACRNQVKTEYLMLMENSEVMLEEVGAQALATAAYQPPDVVVEAVDDVTMDNVIEVTR